MNWGAQFCRLAGVVPSGFGCSVEVEVLEKSEAEQDPANRSRASDEIEKSRFPTPLSRQKKQLFTNIECIEQHWIEYLNFSGRAVLYILKLLVWLHFTKYSFSV